jgi:hypothetical protein
MKRPVVLLLVIALIAGALSTTALAAKKKKKPKKPAPVAVDTTFHIVWGGEACALSTTTDAANPDEACADIFWGALGEELSEGPALIPAVDGLPLAIDAAKPIKGKLSMQSWYFTGAIPDVMGVGQAKVDVVLTGTAAGEEIVIGEVSTEPYVVTPASADYSVEFEIQPAPELAGKVFDGLTLSLQTSGNQMFHGVFPADGSSTLTIGAFAPAP